MNETLVAVLAGSAETIPQPWYLIGGGIYQTVWNFRHGRDPGQDIGDYDLVYFDRRTTEEQEQSYERTISSYVPAARIEVKNQALITDAWYESTFHCPKDTSDYLSLEDAIGKAYVFSPVIGVSWKDREWQILELADFEALLNLSVFPNSKFRDRRVMPFYSKKCCKWHARWPLVTFHDWDGQVIKNWEAI